MLAVIWVVSVLLATPTLVFSTTVLYSEDRQQERHACLMIWPDGDPSVSLLDHSYQVTSICCFKKKEKMNENSLTFYNTLKLKILKINKI